VAVRSDLELGGTDQLFNLLFGRDIQRGYGQEPQDVAVFPLLEGPDGRRMSKSLGNYIGIAEPPEEIYGKTMSIPDRLTEQYLRLVSGLSPEEVGRTLDLGPRDAKAALARQLVRRLQGEEAALRAEEDFRRKFVERGRPDVVPERAFGFPITVVEAMVESGFARSRGDARRLLQQRGVRVNDQVIEDDRPLQPGDVLQVGKRSFVRAVVR
jgi:tyrosyl-tRNA synthetase